MTAFLTTLGEITTFMLGLIGSILTLYTTNPVLTLTFGVFILGASVGIIGRLFSRG